MTAKQDLPQLAASYAEVREILVNAAIPHRAAARQINLTYGTGTTSENSVRRYRKRLHDGAVPKPAPKPAAAPKTGGGWVPRIDIDQDGGEFFTVPAMADGSAPETSEDELLASFDLNPEDWEVVSARKSMWQGGPGGSWLQAHKVSFRKRQRPADGQDMDIEGIFSRYIAPHPTSTRLGDRRIVMVPTGDLQLGKPEGGGSAGTIERFLRITDEIGDHLETHLGNQVLILPWLGDCIEGIVSQNSRLIAQLDLSITEQVRAYRRLMMHQIASYAPLCEQMIIPVVPGNHDETTRVQQMPLSDSWAIEGAMAVQDWMDGRPEYDHVQFHFPREGEPDVTLNVGTDDHAYLVTFIHGHTPGKQPGGIIDWWARQSHGRQDAGMADMLVSAHFHHLRVENTGGGRTWLQIPALDGGSSWYRHRKGDDAPTGIVSLEITPGIGQGWRNLSVHS